MSNKFMYLIYHYFTMADTKSPTAPEVNGQTVTTPETKKGTGMEPKTIALLCYLFAPLSSIIFLLTEKETPNWGKVKFDVMQSLYAGIVMIVLTVVLSVTVVLACVPVIFWFYLLYVGIKSYQGQKVEIPVISGFVK